jgi:LuxR family maltose regulon positive regulatory protein
LVELRAADVRFTAGEAISFFSRTLPAAPAPETIDLLVARSEGWAAGLRLASIALQRQTPSAGAVASFASGGQTLALDYLLGEVFERQPPEMQDFLLRTAVVERLCAPLCHALLPAGSDGSSEAPSQARAPGATGRALLTSAIGANLFLTPLEEPAAGGGGGLVWYRYHPLFRDLLLDQLRMRRGPLAEQSLHARASTWFAGAGMVEDGILHARAAGDAEAATALVERHAFRLLEDDEWRVLERWLDLLPLDAVERRPVLLVARGFMAQRRGQYSALPAFVEAATDALARLPAGGARPAAPDRAAIEGAIAVLAHFRCFVEGDAPGMLANAERALQLLPEAYPYLRGGAAGNAGLAALAVEGEQAALHRLEALPSIAAGRATATATALPGIGVAMFLAGRQHEVAQAGRTMLRLSERQGQTVIRSWGHVLLGTAHYEWDQLADATEHLAAALEARERVRLMPLRAGTFGLALALQAQGRAGEADDVLDQLADTLLRTANASQLAWVGAFRVRLALLRGDLAPARRWLASSDRLAPHWLDGVMDSPRLTRVWARLCLAAEAPSPTAELRDVLAEIESLLATAEHLHLAIRQAQAQALRALAQDALGQSDAALDSLARALDLGEPGGIVRTFVDLGPPLAGVLRRLVARQPRSVYRRQVLAACEGAPPRSLVAAPPDSQEPDGHLVEPLTGRELDVLERLRRQWLNKEIADDLHVSPETVKTHVAHVCAKLGVSDRRRAVRRAAELGLLQFV